MSSDAGIRAEAGDLPGWSLRAATVTGARHRLAGLGNDDAFAWRSGASALVVAVADGVGSVPSSAFAASLAVSAAVEAAAGTTQATSGIVAANNALDGAAGATTLVVAVITEDGTVTLSRVGDSSAFILADGQWEECFDAGQQVGDADGVVSTGTAALPAGSPHTEAVSVHLKPGQVLVLATDGVADPLRDGPKTVAPALAEALRAPLRAIALAEVVDFSRQGCHDDRTLLAVWRAPFSTDS